MEKKTLMIHSIFKSIEGEVSPHNQGAFTIFVRTCGCNLRCSYCDTLEAQNESTGKPMTLKGIIAELASLKCRNVTFTGGEPLCQSTDLMKKLMEELHYYFSISVETNGSKSIEPFRGLARFVMDYKLPSSGMEKHMNLQNFSSLSEMDFVKFVISNKEDFKQALKVKKQMRRNGCQAVIAYSPAYKIMNPAVLFELMAKKNSRGILSMQLHKEIQIL